MQYRFNDYRSGGVIPAHRLEGFAYTIQGSPARYVERKALELRDWLIEHA